jgi:hypothetical protein
MLCLKELPTSADGRLCRAVPRKDATGDISWDIDVSFNIRCEEDAYIANEYVPGALQAWHAGQDGSKGSVKSTSGYDLVHVIIDDGNNQEKIATGHSDIRHCVVNINGQDSSLVVRFRLHGLLPHAASAMVYKLDEIIVVKLSSHQLSVFGNEISSVFESQIIGKVALVEVGEDQHCGIVTEETEESVSLDLINGSLKIESPYKLLSTVNVIPQEGFAFDQLLASYKEAMVSIGRDASWHDLIESMGQMYASNQLEAKASDYSDDFAFELNGTVIKNAISLCSERESENAI